MHSANTATRQILHRSHNLIDVGFFLSIERIARHIERHDVYETNSHTRSTLNNYIRTILKYSTLKCNGNTKF